MFFDNDQILDHILTMPSGYERNKAVYLYNRVNDDALAYRGGAAMLDFEVMTFAIDDGKNDVRRLLLLLDGENLYDYDHDHIEQLFSTWVWDHVMGDDTEL